ncbi:peptidylprolyl isomerase [Motiliproteus sp. SC1-56]|uniref:FKBP-type peptidyl-prolyl cis-trans isomerase n=1 Tax=Motiliproteus sp. SC1-56 TaxID=2799565 RepID=UPI001A8BFF30|nr:peptidylprolyl isomerase [Motiliproteus sp. SC1-56]
MQIADKKVASIHYTLTDDQGEVIDSSSGGEPLTYLHGASNIIPGLESALTGKVTGDKLSVTVAPEEGYGPVHPDLVQTVSKEAFTGVEEIAEGMRFQASTANGQLSVVVTKVEGDQVTVDGNHPLAGQNLNFEVEVADVREASEDELAHGHVHSAGCNH